MSDTRDGDKDDLPSVFDDTARDEFLRSIQDLNSEDESPENEDGEDAEIELTDDERKVLDEFKGDPRAIAKAYANQRSLHARHTDELGELRREVSSLRQAVAPEKEETPPEDEGPFKTNEYGVKFIPDEVWRSPEYISSVVQQFIDAGYSEEDARLNAPIYINQLYNKHQKEVDQATQEARYGKQQTAEADDRTVAQEQSVKQQERMDAVTDAMANELLLSYPEEAVVEILKQVEDRARAFVIQQHQTGKMTLRQITSPDIVEDLYYNIYTAMLRGGDVRKILTLEKPATQMQRPQGLAMRPTVSGGTPVGGGIGISDERRQQMRQIRQDNHAASLSSEENFYLKNLMDIGIPRDKAIDTVMKTRGKNNG